MSTCDHQHEDFSQWYVTENVIDHLTCTAECELCGKTYIRYHFEVQKIQSNQTKWVGSSCILKYGIVVYDGEGKVLDSIGAGKKLNDLQEKCRFESCIKSLEALAEAEDNNYLSLALEYFKKNKYLSPKLAAIVAWRMKENEIDYSPSFFRVSFKRHQYQMDFSRMPTWKAHTIWDMLSPSQRKYAQQFHQPPKQERDSEAS